MNLKTYKKLRVIVALFIAMTVSFSITLDNIFLAVIAVLTGFIFMLLIKSKVKDVMIDERVQAIGEKAARMAFHIVTIVMGLSSFILVLLAKSSAPYLEGVGYILSYLTLFSLIVYSASFYYFNRKYGGSDDKE